MEPSDMNAAVAEKDRLAREQRANLPETIWPDKDQKAI